MNTVNPRTSVTLSPALDELVTRFSLVAGSSKSQVLRDLLEAAEPALQRAMVLMEAASVASSGVLEGLAQSLNRAQDKIEADLREQLEKIDLDANSGGLGEGPVIRGRRAQSADFPELQKEATNEAPTGQAPHREKGRFRAKKASQPPRPVTRGVGSSPEPKEGL